MYSKADISIITNRYFQIIKFHPNYCILKSKNTGHRWHISQSTDGYFILLHKHHEKEDFHFQRGCVTVEDCMLEIAGHDDFQLRGRKPERYKRRTFFDDIVEIYSN